MMNHEKQETTFKHYCPQLFMCTHQMGQFPTLLYIADYSAAIDSAFMSPLCWCSRLRGGSGFCSLGTWSGRGDSLGVEAVGPLTGLTGRQSDREFDWLSLRCKVGLCVVDGTAATSLDGLKLTILEQSAVYGLFSHWRFEMLWSKATWIPIDPGHWQEYGAWGQQCPCGWRYI